MARSVGSAGTTEVAGKRGLYGRMNPKRVLGAYLADGISKLVCILVQKMTPSRFAYGERTWRDDRACLSLFIERVATIFRAGTQIGLSPSVAIHFRGFCWRRVTRAQGQPNVSKHFKDCLSLQNLISPSPSFQRLITDHSLHF